MIGKRWKIAGGFALLLALGWSGAWLYGRQQALARIDPALARLAERGTTLACPDRSVGGWPFSLAVTCRGATADLADGTRLAFAALTLGASLDDWHGLGFSAEGPVTAALADGRQIEAGFSALRGRIEIADGRADAVTASADGVAATLMVAGGVAASAAAAALTLKIDLPTDDGDDGSAALALRGAAIRLAGRDLAPMPADLHLDMTLTDAVRALAGGALADWQSSGGRLVLDRFDLTLADGRIEASGTASVDADGLVRADVATVATGLDKVAAAAKKAGKPVSGPLAGLTMAYLFLGKPDGAGRRIDVVVDRGAMRANGKSIGSLPPLF